MAVPFRRRQQGQAVLGSLLHPGPTLLPGRLGFYTYHDFSYLSSMYFARGSSKCERNLAVRRSIAEDMSHLTSSPRKSWDFLLNCSFKETLVLLLAILEPSLKNHRCCCISLQMLSLRWQPVLRPRKRNMPGVRGFPNDVSGWR